MRTLLRAVFSPLLSLVIVMLGNSFFTTFINISLTEELPKWVVGLLNSSYYAGILVGCFNMEKLIRRIGHIRAFTGFAAMNATIVMLQAITPSPICIIFYRFIVGLCVSGFFIVIESWLLLLSDSHSKGKVLSLYMLALYLAQGFGQFILNLVDLGSLVPFCLTVILSCASIIPVCLMPALSPPLPESRKVRLREIMKSSPLGFIGCILSGMMIGVFMGLGPSYGKDAEFSIWQISQMMGLTILGGLTLQWPVGYLSDLFDRRKVLYNISLALLLICIALFFSSRFSFNAFLILSIIFGGFAFTLYPISISYTSDRITQASMMTIICVMLTLYGVGCIIGPLIAPFVIQYFGPSGFYLYMSALTGLLYLFGRSRIGQHNVPQGSAYIPIPTTTPQSAHLDPRTAEATESLD